MAALLAVGCASNSIKETQRVIAMIEEADHYYDLGLLSTAEAKYRRILAEQPSYYEAWLKLGNIYVRNDQLEAAVLAYSTCVDNAREDARCWNNLALARVKQAVEVLQEGKTAMETSSTGYRQLEEFQYRIIDLLAK